MKFVILLILSLFTFSCAANYQVKKIEPPSKITYQEKEKTKPKLIAPPPAYGNKIVWLQEESPSKIDVVGIKQNMKLNISLMLPQEEHQCYKQSNLGNNELVMLQFDINCFDHILVTLAVDNSAILGKFSHDF